MSLSPSRLNANRLSSITADLATQFPVPGGLLPAEQAAVTANQVKLAHAIADHEGTDVVTEVENGVVTVTGVTPGGSTSGPGTIS